MKWKSDTSAEALGYFHSVRCADEKKILAAKPPRLGGDFIRRRLTSRRVLCG